ncbi:MFS transporter [Phytohabitans rumicis]|uniref:MFS transporter n=1 Tax=Phytohabitans rumicis TaxID=1076125 RepID=A0A6V8KYL3_9ACTN|nr:MFS transporter [Phytohabitans rumicis]GFJ88470.1 MFS transporter [Phytohabitans rumicis]
MLRYGLAAFTAASALAAVAGTASVLIAARALQGAGAALVVPATLAIVAAQGERERMRCIAIWTAAGAVGLGLGPTTGGVLSEHAHWSWIFLINLPAGAAALACCVPLAEHRPAGAAPVDWAGLATGSLGLLALAYTLIAGTARGFDAPAVLLAAAVAAGAGVAFLPVERRSAAALVDVRLFALRAFSGGIAVQVLWGLGVNGVYFYTALYLQSVRGFTPTGAGLAFLPLALAVAAGAPLAPPLVARFGAAGTVAAGLTLVATGMAAVAVGGSVATLLAALAVIGFGSALTVPLGACVLGAVPADRAGVAAGVFGVAREVSGVLGIAVIGVVVAGAGPGLSVGYTYGLLVAAALVLLGAVLSLRTLPYARQGDTLRR